MSPLARLCPACGRADVGPDRACGATHHRRRARRNRELGRNSRHWRRLRALAIASVGRCQRCGSRGDLTVDLLHGADHSTARLEDVQVLCRRCHDRKDGGKQQPRLF
jgi:5-methylcytosine-specific restriction endonuclease McrA